MSGDHNIYQKRHVSYVCPQCFWTLENKNDNVFEHEWIGLTDDDIIDALDLVGYDAQAFSQAYAVEAKLKEKNK